jgi:serine/threonine protein kinase/Tol biopolymer transport system component
MNLVQYSVTAALGEGGMGEVWRAEDTKLGREVALKVLPEEFAEDPERMARFEREAKVLASLNHPNIATLYGLETVESDTDAGSSLKPQTSSGVTFLAMELVEGEDLSERIERGPVPVEEAVAIALQIAEALEAAHEQGIVHRDLKPANIKLRPDGTVKVLDFGLAKAWESDHGDSSLSLSPTVTNHATAAGLILGTAAYMSPEQAAGTPADRRADIWAFGVVLWEMLTGHKLFEGETVSHVLASVLKDDVDLDELPAGTPARLRELTRRCLQKQPKKRLQAIGEARIALEEPLEPEEGGLVSHRPTAQSPPSKLLPMLGWVVAAVVLAAVAVMFFTRGDTEPVAVYRTSIPPPEGAAFHLAAISPGAATVSPDGTRVVFSARDEDGAVRLFLRAFDQPEAIVMSGTEGAQFPFWSPDSRWVAFFTQQDGTLKKADASGGPPITICDAQNGKGGSWGVDGDIVFSPNAGTPLHRVASSGGESKPITEIDRSRHNSHRHPRFLPDGRHLLYLARGVNGAESAVMIASLDGGDERELMRNLVQAEYAAGHLFFVRDQTLMAQPFDPGRLELRGEATPVAEQALTIPAAAFGVYSVSAAGVLTYHVGAIEAVVAPIWYDRSGREIERLGDPGEYNTVALSPDDRNAAFAVTPGVSGTVDIWTYDLERDLKTRFTFDDATDYLPVWAPDNQKIAFASDRAGSMQIYGMGIGGVEGPELLVESDSDVTPRGWSPDGRWLVYSKQDEETAVDIWAVEIEGGEPLQLRAQRGVEVPGGISPDGRWLAYFSDESGRFEVYVTPFPDAGRRWQASTDSGVFPFWRADGRELVYQRFDGRLMSVEVDLAEDSVRFGDTVELFDVAPPDALGPAFAPSADCQRILVIPKGEASGTTLLNLMVGVPEVLRER